MTQSLTIVPQPMPAFSMSDIEKVAGAIAKGGLFGSKDPYAILTLCLLAQAENQHPAVVFRDYHIISGKPAKKADAMLRDFLAGGGKVEWHSLTDELADATFSHPSGGSARITWDEARVKQAQLGGNAMHKKYPRQMLRARVVSEGVRTVFPGATSGLYVPEEAAAFGDDAAPAQAAIEHHEDAPRHDPIVSAPTAGRKPPLRGPIKTRAEVRNKIGELTRELHSCGDSDELNIVLGNYRELIAQVEDECEFWWNGDGADFKGLKGEIDEARITCAQADGERLVDQMRAG